MMLIALLAATAAPAPTEVLATPDPETMAALAMYGESRDWTKCLERHSLPDLIAGKDVDAVLAAAYKQCAENELWLRRAINHAAAVFAASNDPATQRELAEEPLNADKIITAKKVFLRASLSRVMVGYKNH